KRVSIQERMAIFLSGYLFVMYFSYPFSATKRLLYARISSIMAFITCYCFLLTKIKKLYGSLQALHRKIVPLGNHFRRECTTMAKEKTVYVCSNCGQDSPKWVGKCPS